MNIKVHYAMMNSGIPIKNGISVNTPNPGAIQGASKVANYILDDGFAAAQYFPNIDGSTAATNNRYVTGGSSDWEIVRG